ncbi:hypothetical protein BKA69DRAFT_620975 [Paraphysoderma sedebokerense]|nr:hypothetical protein BKA69DRAFT_620975 [Paraphysoderma sedebokerense]
MANSLNTEDFLEESQFIAKEFLKENDITDEAVIAIVLNSINSKQPDTRQPLNPLTLGEIKACRKFLKIESTGGQAALLSVTEDYVVFLTPAHCLMASPELSNDETLWDEETKENFSGTIPFKDVIIIPSLDFALFNFYPTKEEISLFKDRLSRYDMRPGGLGNNIPSNFLSVTVTSNDSEILRVTRQDNTDFQPGDSGSFVGFQEKCAPSNGIVIARGNTEETRKHGIALRFDFILAVLNSGKSCVDEMRKLSNDLETYKNSVHLNEIIELRQESLIQPFMNFITRMINIRIIISEKFEYIAQYPWAADIVQSIYKEKQDLYAYDNRKRTVFIKLYEKTANGKKEIPFKSWVEDNVKNLEDNDFNILFNPEIKDTDRQTEISKHFLQNHYTILNPFDREWISRAIVAQLKRKSTQIQMVFDILYGVGEAKNTCFLGPKIGKHYTFVWDMLKGYMGTDDDIFGKNVDGPKDGVYKVYTQSDFPLNFKDPKGKAKLKQREESDSDSKGVYHHPLLCELTEWKPKRSHSCIRPSHHVIASKCFNDKCTKLNKNIGDRLPLTSSNQGPDASNKNMVMEKFKEAVEEEQDTFLWSLG